jgi:WD40 repeat protein
MKRCVYLLVLCTLASLSVPGWSQATSSCSMAQPPLRSDKPNIFNDEQEQWLGDAHARQQESGYDLLPAKDSAELDRIGRKVLSMLPETQTHYTFRVYESSVANAFSLAGGYIYVSRKLITDARSEDEVAGVLAHEIGHIYTHQIAVSLTRRLRALLKVDSLGGKEDVEDKLQLLLNAPWKYGAEESEDDAEKDELLADRVGMYAMVKAGYAPRAFAENLDRIAANKGHTGNILTDLLGTTSEISLRVRVARKVSGSLPEACGKLQPGASPQFKSFQEAVRSAPIHPLIEPTPGLTSLKLDPPMHPALSQVRFSPDGKLVLAQDENAIHVLSRSPLKRLFSIAARSAMPAQFTPDSKQVVFHFPSLRVERWDVATGSRSSFHELIDYEGCMQTSLSPDGKTFICLSTSQAGVWLKLSDVESGRQFYENKNFYVALTIGSPDVIVRNGGTMHVGTVTYSQDGSTVLILCGARALAFDLVERKPISLGNDLNRLIEGRAAFVDSKKLVFACDWEYKAMSSRDTFKMCETTFPDGMPLNEFKIGYQWLDPITRGDHVLIGPFKDNAAMLAEPSTGKATLGFKMDSLDIYDQYLATENERGGVTVGELGGQNMESVELPPAEMIEMQAAGFSPDGRFLAYSSKARSSIWDLKTQKRVSLMRPFRAVRFNDQDIMFAQYTETHQRPGQNFQIDLKTGKASEGAKFAIDQFQNGDVLVTFQPFEKTGDTSRNIDLQIADTTTGAALWSRRFPHEAPVVRQSEDGALLFIMDLREGTAEPETKHAGPKFVKSSDTRYEAVAQGLLIEVLDSHTGDLRRAIQVPERPGEWSSPRTAAVYGDYLVVHGIANNSVIYRVSDGKRLGAFYGRVIAGDGELGLLAATNRDQEVIVYSAADGKEMQRMTVDHWPRAARFIRDRRALLVLTASQAVYPINLPSGGLMQASDLPHQP